MKKRINITLSESILKTADSLASKRGMNRSEFINYLINKESDLDSGNKELSINNK